MTRGLKQTPASLVCISRPHTQAERGRLAAHPWDPAAQHSPWLQPMRGRGEVESWKDTTCLLTRFPAARAMEACARASVP